MTRKKVWFGSLGPFFYDDAVDVHDPDEVIVEKQAGVVSEGAIKSLETPVAPEDVIRLEDLEEVQLLTEATVESSTFFFARIY